SGGVVARSFGRLLTGGRACPIMGSLANASTTIPGPYLSHRMSSMTKHPRFVTLSKYPPYRSGHAKQALWNNTALAALTGAEQHQVTYCGVSTDPEDDAGAGVQVHHVREVRGNRRVPDGHLLRAVAAELFSVALATDIDVINTYYIDPHATIANRVADALGLLGRRPIIIHSIEGSDV